MENNTQNNTEWEIIHHNKLDSGFVTYAFALPIQTISALLIWIVLKITVTKKKRKENVKSFPIYHISLIRICAHIINCIKFIRSMGLIPFPWRIFSRIVSPLANSTLYAAIWMQLVLAINRLWAISHPMTYNRAFNPKNARIIVVSLWLFSILITALYYNVECEHYVETEFYSWSTLFGPCEHSFLTYIAVLLSDGIFLAILIVDIIASYHVIAYLKVYFNFIS
ncbi:unnamed protein product [Onchocerca flexuosa]|uniref:G_PROTEIN_RECEP_F1_2 domain-containing protein n=1 Tax=Onchocerca flexuosa TaxID=387005 RepID=A0A183HEI0_9BILA|nr:unnamed protein product [Onchocerca flexuosa]